MSLKTVKILIAVTSIGRIWSKNRTEIKILSTLTSLGFLALFFDKEKQEHTKSDIEQYNNRF